MNEKKIINVLKTYYPIKIEKPLTDIADVLSLELSHMSISNMPSMRWSNHYMDFKHVTHVFVDSSWIPKKHYLETFVRYIYINDLIYLYENPEIFPIFSDQILEQLGLLVQSYRLKNGSEVKTIPVKKFPLIKQVKSNGNNFVFTSFDLDTNGKYLRDELLRLVINRDKYDTLNFHLEGCYGGDLIPVHFIMMTLCGGKEKWMTQYHTKQRNMSTKRTFTWLWDPWTYESFIESLNISIQSTSRYTGKINLHVNKECGSTTWYFITYMIYAFSTRIKRETKTVYGRKIKLGTFTSSQLKLIGYSSTSSGDGNAQEIKVDRNTKVTVPLQATIERPIKQTDWNRFWLPK